MQPKVSVVIPSLNGNVECAVASLRRQTVTTWELVVVKGVRPAARARNQAVRGSDGDMILFLDDDAELGHARVLEQMLDAMKAPDVAVVGTSKILPPTSTGFQRRVAAEVPRWVFAILERDLESNPPVDSYGFAAATTTCCLVRRSAINEVGGFDERLPTGEDTELFYRIRKAGYRFVVPAHCWAYHSPPSTLWALVKKSFLYGVGHAREARKEPGRNMDLIPLNRRWATLALIAAPVAFLPSLFVSVELTPRLRVTRGLRPLRSVASFAALYGYAWGVITDGD